MPVKVRSDRKTEDVEELVQHHQGAVRAFLSYLGCRADRLDDLLQDVFLSFLAARFENRGEAATRAFLRRIARNVFLKAVQKDRRQIVSLDPIAAENAWVEFDREDDGSRYMGALRRCLALLDGRPAEILRLRYEKNVQLSTVATDLGMKESSVKSVLVRTRRKLRECIERRMTG